jgi:hypothetical protein
VEWLKGKRTYLLAAAALIAILARYLNGDITPSSAVNEALVALGLVTARLGAKQDDAKKEEPKP